jgi:biopolymer transport protein ExbB
MHATGQSAIAADPAGALDRLAGLIAAGGPVMYAIAGLSVLALAVILLKGAQFLRLGRAGGDAVAEAVACWRAADGSRSLELLAWRRHPVARALAHVVGVARRGVLDRHDLEDEAARFAGAEIARLRAGLRVLELIATLAPLLGLLGTVLGMIEAFRALEAAGSRVDPAILSGGIWVALLTTAAGLVVAIPAAAAYSLFAGFVDDVARALEDALTQLLATIGQLPASAATPRLAAGRAG